MGELLHAEASYAIRGAVLEVDRELGSGFLEAVYQGCLENEFNRRKLPNLPPKDSINLDCVRAVPRAPWLKNWFPMDMQTAFDTVVCLLAFPQDLDEHPCRGRSQENHSTKEAGMSQSLPLGV